jgi:hypothetical protein
MRAKQETERQTSRRRIRLGSGIMVALVVLWSSSAGATRIIPSSLEYMTNFSDAVVIGYVASLESYWEDQKIFTNVVLEVEEFLKNAHDESATRLTLKVLGGTVGDTRFEVDNSPRFTVGEKVMLFLKKANEAYVPYGLSYGVYQVTFDPEQNQEYVHGPLFRHSKLYNLNTMRAVSNTELLGKTALNTFVERVRKLVEEEPEDRGD